MRKIHHDNTYHGHTMCNSGKLNDGCYEEILERAKTLLNYMIQRHSRVFFTVFVLHYPEYSASQYPVDNGLLSMFLEAFTLYCSRHGYPTKYLWVRERSMETGQFHYHLMLLYEYDAIRNTHTLLEKANDLWRSYLNMEGFGRFVHSCPWQTSFDQLGGVKIMRNDPQFPQAYDRCFQQASYLAKCYSKGDLPPYVKGYDSSRLN